MLLQLTRKETLAAALCANVLLVRMLQSEVVSNFLPVDRGQALDAEDLVRKLWIRTVVRQKVGVQINPRVKRLEMGVYRKLEFLYFGKSI